MKSFIRFTILASIAAMIFFIPRTAYALDVQMGSNGNLVFDPSEVTIQAGESVHFINNMLPPHNVIVEGRPDLGHESLAMLPGDDFEIAFTDAGDYTYWCAPHKGAGMIGTVHVE